MSSFVKYFLAVVLAVTYFVLLGWSLYVLSTFPDSSEAVQTASRTVEALTALLFVAIPLVTVLAAFFNKPTPRDRI